MAKQKDRRESVKIFDNLSTLAAVNSAAQPPRTFATAPPPGELTKMKKFRFQLLHRWMITHMKPCCVADVGGGKGLLSYLLQQSGWTSTVIDPVSQALPTKYKSLSTNRQTKIGQHETVPRLDQAFEPSMAQHFDFLVAMHAHGCNIQLIDAARRHGCGLLLLPCCVIHEPILPPHGKEWIVWLLEYMMAVGFEVTPFQLNFKGQNIGLYAQKPLPQE